MSTWHVEASCPVPPLVDRTRASIRRRRREVERFTGVANAVTFTATDRRWTIAFESTNPSAGAHVARVELGFLAKFSGCRHHEEPDTRSAHGTPFTVPDTPITIRLTETLDGTSQ